MRLLTNWLREFVEIPVDDRRLAEDLTMAGLAVDAVEKAPNGEPVLDVDITTNRPDAMNHYGTAREASVLYDRDLKTYGPKLEESARRAADVAAVEIADPDLCARYSARVIRGIKVGPSPPWMVRRLEAAGARSINNVADVTNYLLMEFGHPLHAFDLERLAGSKIVVRRARPGETLATLDGLERRFAGDHLVIADAEKPVAIAGVMGGLESGISERTVDVLLESAWFDPLSIRRTARHFGMHTDASHRFERGADVTATATAADRAAELIREVAGGEILGGLLEAYPRPLSRNPLELRRSELDRILGVAVPDEDVLRILKRLGFQIKGYSALYTAHSALVVIPPAFRLDIEREIDVIEEVARHYGYQRFPSCLPAWWGTAHRAPGWRLERAVRETVRALGYDETISFTLVPRPKTGRFASRPPVRIANPLSAEAGVLRTSAMPGLLAAVEWNLNRAVAGLKLFEIGNLFFAKDDGAGFEEPPVLALAMTGPLGALSPHGPVSHADFYQLKGDVETVLELFDHSRLYFDPSSGAAYYHPGRSARAVMDGETVARFGELDARVAAEYGFRQPVLAAEFLLDRLYRRGLGKASYQPVPRFPAVERDFSLLLPEGTLFERVDAAIRDLHLPELAEIFPVEIFRGGPVPAGRYSLLLRVRFQSRERTLSDAEVNRSAEVLVAALEKQVGATLRG